MPDLRRRLLASTLLVGAAVFAQPAFAQSGGEVETSQETSDAGDPAQLSCDENPNSPECAAEGSAIVVTGSRIASPTLTSASPLQIVDSADIDQSGVVNVQEVLLENPAFGTPGLSRTNSNFLTSSVGVASVNLRNLGANRTLVLVNGRRFVAGVSASPIVDLNTIPTQFIERIDILTGGASSIYGSDAVAGVVNIIYKDDFEGIEANGQIGVSERGDDVRKQANLLMGTNFADGRGNVAVHLGYSNEGAVFTRNREISAVDQISCYFVTEDLEDVFKACRPFLSGFNPSGTITAGDSLFTFDPRTGVIRSPATNGAGGTRGEPGGGLVGDETGFNRSAFRTIAVPTERYLMAFRGNYEVSDNITAFTEGTFAKTSTVAEIEPFPLQTSGVGGTFPASGGFFPIERDVELADGTIVRVRNPLVPQVIFDAATDVDGDGLRDVAFTRRMSDLGTRGATADRTTYRFLAGVEGRVFGDWNWDAYYSFGETTEAQISGGQVNQPNFRFALDVIPDVNDVDGDGNTTEPVCRDPQARAEGCAPADVFNGAGRISPAAVAYLSAPAFFNTKTTQKLAGANISGKLFDPWGAGPIGVAIGTEYRKEFSSAKSDALTISGQNGGNARPDISGSFDVIEGYAELAVPILSDRPFFDQLEFRGAVRVSDYSTIGTVYSWNAGVEWAPIPDIRFRAVKARATRAPNIGELFTAPSQTFPPGLVDPCEGVTAATGGTLGTQCRADPGVAANIAANGAFTLNQADEQGVSGFNSGNPNLGEEKSDTLTIGAVVNPRSISWLRNFSFTVDYFNIKIEDAIVATPRPFILDQCYNEGNQAFCGPQFIVRRPANEGPYSAGSLAFINSAVTNSGGFETKGIDVTASYRQNLENWGLAGTLNARFSYTHVFKGLIIPLPGEDEDPFNREVGASRNKAFGQLAYTLGDFTGVLRGTYIGPAYLDDQFTGIKPGEEDSEFFKVGSEFVLDLQLRWSPGDHYEFYVGADNLLDNAPPLIPTGLPGGNTGVETNAGTYDAIGRRFYAGATLKF